MSLRRVVLPSPLGPVTVLGRPDALVAVGFGETYTEVPLGGDVPLLARARTQLEEYFAGALREFDLPLALGGTAFRRRVHAALLTIPYGETRSYGDVARAIGRPGASRAVGRANHDNEIAIVVPCHRVVGADGALVGYASGVERKRWLLALEARSGRWIPSR